MIRVLNVAEKPSVARELTTILSRGQYHQRTTQSKYNAAYEFKLPQQQFLLGNSNEDAKVEMIVTSVTGHLMELEFASAAVKQSSWSRLPPATLFTEPVAKRVPQDRQLLLRALESEALKCQWLILWLDCDREGENIAFEVLDVCRAVQPALRVFRARFSALTRQDCERALAHLVEPDRRAAEAVDCRQEIDLRIGSAFTRWQTLRLQQQFPAQLKSTSLGDSKGVLSYGPCQFPTLGFVVKRAVQRREFVSQQYWMLKFQLADPRDAQCVAAFQWDRGHCYSHAATVMRYEQLLGQEARIDRVFAKECRRQRPYPLNTVALQKKASQTFHLSSEATMKLAEHLYQRGIISYPRTETDSYPASLDMESMLQTQAQHPQWGAYALALMNGAFSQPLAGSHNDEAHPPIMPLKCVTNLTGNEARIYDLVARHFLASVSNDALGKQTTVEASILRRNAEGHLALRDTFKARGLMITQRNYLDVYPFDKWQGTRIPVLQEGHTFVPPDLRIESGATQAPPLLSESDLISLMDKNGIGTDATIAQHIKTIQDRHYAVMNAARQFEPTPIGFGLVAGYDAMQLDMSSPLLRAHMEQCIKQICTGEREKAHVLQAILHDMALVFAEVQNRAQLLDLHVGRHLAEAPQFTLPNPSQQAGLQSNNNENVNPAGQQRAPYQQQRGPPLAPASSNAQNVISLDDSPELQSTRFGGASARGRVAARGRMQQRAGRPRAQMDLFEDEDEIEAQEWAQRPPDDQWNQQQQQNNNEPPPRAPVSAPVAQPVGQLIGSGVAAFRQSFSLIDTPSTRGRAATNRGSTRGASSASHRGSASASASGASLATSNCYACGGTGHWASACPTRQQQQQQGAAASAWPQVEVAPRGPRAFTQQWQQLGVQGQGAAGSAGGSSMASVICYACQQMGHLSNACPNR